VKKLSLLLQKTVPLVTASRTSTARDNTSTAGLNLDAYPNVQNTRSKNPDQYWKSSNGSLTTYASTSEVFSGARTNGTFANRLLRGDFGENNAISFMQYDVAAAIGDFNAKFEMLLLFTPGPLGLLGLGGKTRWGHVTLYHGTNAAGAKSIINGIHLGRNGTDFGKGFYLSESYSTALRATKRIGGDPVILKFKVSFSDYRRLSGLRFGNSGSQWQNFISHNRFSGKAGLNIHGYDFVSGPMFGRVNSKGEILPIVRRGILERQFSIHTQKSISIFDKSLIKP